MRRLICSLVLVSGMLRAEILPPPADIPPPPRLPPALEPNAEEPEIRIIEMKDAIHTEYRLHGKLYMIKVEPKVGKPYILVDPEGRGAFERRDEVLGPRISVPRWVLFEF